MNHLQYRCFVSYSIYREQNFINYPNYNQWAEDPIDLAQKRLIVEN